MEFVRENEVWPVLRTLGLRARPPEGECVHLELDSGAAALRLVLKANGRSAANENAGASLRAVDIAPERYGEVIVSLIGRLHADELVLMPIGKWRHVFDTVAFSMVGDERWQDMDATATIERNTRDPLITAPGDLHTVEALIKAILRDAEQPEQGIAITTTAAPVLVEVVPGGSCLVAIGNPALADEVVEGIPGLSR